MSNIPAEKIAELRQLIRKEENRLMLHATFDTRPLTRARADLAEHLLREKEARPSTDTT